MAEALTQVGASVLFQWLPLCTFFVYHVGEIQIFSKEVEQHGIIDDCTAGVPHLRHRLCLPETFEDGYQIDIRHVSIHTAAASDIRYVLP